MSARRPEGDAAAGGLGFLVAYVCRETGWTIGQVMRLSRRQLESLQESFVRLAAMEHGVPPARAGKPAADKALNEAKAAELAARLKKAKESGKKGVELLAAFAGRN